MLPEEKNATVKGQLLGTANNNDISAALGPSIRSVMST